MEDLAQSWSPVLDPPFLEKSFSVLLQAALEMLKGWERIGICSSPAAGPEQGSQMSERGHLQSCCLCQSQLSGTPSTTNREKLFADVIHP